MDKVKCELCPLQDYCPELRQAKLDNQNSYHPQEIVRAYESDCRLLKVIKPEEVAKHLTKGNVGWKTK